MACINEDVSIFCGAYPERCTMVITSLLLLSALWYIRLFLSRKHGILEGVDFSKICFMSPEIYASVLNSVPARYLGEDASQRHVDQSHTQRVYEFRHKMRQKTQERRQEEEETVTIMSPGQRSR